MITLPIILILLLIAWRFKSIFKKHSLMLYIISAIISGIAAILIENPIFKLFKMGYLALAFIYVVMLVGALPIKNKSQNENHVRRDYAILGFITLLPHVIYFIMHASAQENGPIIFGVISFISMIPLFITSFKYIRHKMNDKTWIRLQKLAYVSYISLFIHLMIHSQSWNQILYIVLFVGYFILKIIFEYKKFRVHKM